MEETRKRRNEQNDVDSSPATKRPRAGEEGGAGALGDDIMAWLSMDDDTMSELMNLLDSTNGADSVSSLTKVKFIDNPYTSPLVFQSSASYITINGNEESCGSSFSDSESSLMVSVDMGGMGNTARELELGAWSANELDALKWVSEKEGVEKDDGGFLRAGEMDGCDGSDLDDYVLARFLIEEALF